MDYIKQNPYRVLGAFANDPLRVRTANLAKIRAYRKVGKECVFDNDFVEVFGAIDRSEEAIAQAISQLSNEEDAEFYSLLWLHRTESLPTTIHSAEDIVAASQSGSSFAEIINTLLGAYATDDHPLVAKAVGKLFDNDRTGLFFDEEKDISPENKRRLLKYIVYNFTISFYVPIFDWWKTFNTTFYLTQVLWFDGSKDIIYREFNLLSISALEKCSSHEELKKNFPEWQRIKYNHSFALKTIEVIKESSVRQTNEPNAAGQIAMSEYAATTLYACKRCYKNSRYWDAKPVRDILSLVKELRTLSYSSKTKDMCEEFEQELEAELKYLAPDELQSQSAAIRKEIEEFCNKPDETQWAIALVRNCVPHLIRIKTALGAEHPYYLRISTKIADNALYSCMEEVKEMKRKYDNPIYDIHTVLCKLRNTLQLAFQLCANIRAMNTEPQFIERKLSRFEKELEDYCNEHKEIKIVKSPASISLQTEEEAFAACNDYFSLLAFIRNYPNSPHIEEAKQRILVIEIRNEELKELAIKAEFDRCKTIADYNRFILAHPSHKLSLYAKSEMEHLTYLNARDTGRYNEYYRLYPHGCFFNKLKEEEEKETFIRCTTPNDYERYVMRYPHGAYLDLAKAIVKRSKREHILNVGWWIATLGLSLTLIFLIVQCLSPSGSRLPQEKPAKVSPTKDMEEVDDSIYNDSLSSYDFTPEDPYINNSLATGSKPYASYFGRARTGGNYIEVNTQAGSDYVVIVKRHRDQRYINHIYIKGGDKAKMYVPDGTFDVYFYSGNGWNPDKTIKKLKGGFVSGESMQKDDPVEIVSAYLTYTLYPVLEGNLRLQKADISDILN